MRRRDEITPEICRELLRYEPETGKLYWRSTPNHKNSYAGREALTAEQGQGYLSGKLLGNSVRAHRIAWAIHYGEWPASEIDHINGDRQDNRITNMRLATTTENNRNLAKPVTNTSGAVGVTWCKRARKWQARIVIDNVARSLGYHAEFQDALAARQAAERANGFSGNHGQRKAWGIS